MSQMCPSSSHQLVAAAIAFRRARRKFPKNFGQLAWPVQYERKDSKPEPLSPMKTCKKCEERFLYQQEIRNVRSNDVWPQMTASWSTDPRSTRSMRESNTPLGRRKGGAAAAAGCGGCACRRIYRSTKRNVVVSFRDDEKSNNRCSGGDGAGGRSSNETISSRSCQIQGDPSDCTSLEKRENFEDRRRKKSERKSRTLKKSSCLPRNFTNNDNLDLLYDRSCRTKNSVSFLSNDRGEKSSLEEEDEAVDFPSWKDRARDYPIEATTGPGRIIPDEEATVICECTRKRGEEAWSESHRDHWRQRRHRSHESRHESVLDEDLLAKPVSSRASSSKESRRLCKGCALGQCPRNSVTVGSLREDQDSEGEDDRGGRVDDTCAIKHKDSMALLVEKFKNKKITACSDDETIFKSDEDSASKTKMNERTIAGSRTSDKEDDAGYEASQDEDESCCKNHRNSVTSKTSRSTNRTSSKSLKSRKSRSGCCSSSKESLCRHVL